MDIKDLLAKVKKPDNKKEKDDKHKSAKSTDLKSLLKIKLFSLSPPIS